VSSEEASQRSVSKMTVDSRSTASRRGDPGGLAQECGRRRSREGDLRSRVVSGRISQAVGAAVRPKDPKAPRSAAIHLRLADSVVAQDDARRRRWPSSCSATPTPDQTADMSEYREKTISGWIAPAR